MNEIEAKVKKMCRGCFVEASSEDDMHSFQWPEIRELFEECTAITISVLDRKLPQKLCSNCYKKCEDWYSFRTMCHEIDEFLHSPSFPGDVSTPMIKLELEDSDYDMYDNSPDAQPSPEPVDPQMLDETTNYNNPTDEKQLNPNDSYSVLKPCPICTEKVYSLLLHFSEKHLHSEDKECPICARRFAQHHQLRNHMVVHFDERPFSCSWCKNRAYSLSFVLKAHLMKHHPEHVEEQMRRTREPCPICQKKCRTKLDRDAHIRMHGIVATEDSVTTTPGNSKKEKREEQSSPRQVPNATDDSDETPKKENHDHSLNSKEKSPAKEEKMPLKTSQSTAASSNQTDSDYVCKECNKGYTQEKNLLYHLAKNHPHLAEVYSRKITKLCPVCDHRCTNLMRYERHMLKYHPETVTTTATQTTERTFPCQQCDRWFSSSGRLKQHCRIRHRTGDFLYQCEKCSKGYFSLANYKTHIRKHGWKDKSREEKKRGEKEF